jgi:hypothetical protein
MSAPSSVDRRPPRPVGTGEGSCCRRPPPPLAPLPGPALSLSLRLSLLQNLPSKHTHTHYRLLPSLPFQSYGSSAPSRTPPPAPAAVPRPPPPLFASRRADPRPPPALLTHPYVSAPPRRAHARQGHVQDSCRVRAHQPRPRRHAPPAPAPLRAGPTCPRTTRGRRPAANRGTRARAPHTSPPTLLSSRPATTTSFCASSLPPPHEGPLHIDKHTRTKTTHTASFHLWSFFIPTTLLRPQRALLTHAKRRRASLLPPPHRAAPPPPPLPLASPPNPRVSPSRAVRSRLCVPVRGCDKKRSKHPPASVPDAPPASLRRLQRRAFYPSPPPRPAPRPPISAPRADLSRARAPRRSP